MFLVDAMIRRASDLLIDLFLSSSGGGRLTTDGSSTGEGSWHLGGESTCWEWYKRE